MSNDIIYGTIHRAGDWAYGRTTTCPVFVNWDGDASAGGNWAAVLSDFGATAPEELEGRRVQTRPADQFVYPEDVASGQSYDVKIKGVARDAEIAFWAHVAEAYPEAESGDLAPDEAFPFTQAAEKVVGQWVENNVPKAVSASVKLDFDGVVAWAKRLSAVDVNEQSRDEAVRLLMLASSVNRDAPIGELLDLLGIKEK